MADGAAVTLAAVLRESIARLRDAGRGEPGLDARLLVEHFTGTTRTQALTEPGRVLAAAAAEQVRKAIERRAAGEPVHRILGYRSFYGLDLMLSPETLEPRPDTETLVSAVLPLLHEIASRKGGCSVLDLGTGTGAIALALLDQVKTATATGVDRAQAALDTARRNAIRLGLGDRFSTVRSDWFDRVAGTWDVIVSNPPYIRRAVIAGLGADVRDHDPHLALDGGEDGLDAYRRIATDASRFLKEDGLVLLEIGFGQKIDVSDIFQANGFALLSAHRDFGGNDRALIFECVQTAAFHET